VLVETERFVIWVSNEPDNEKVYHVELDTVTVHFFAEDWEEFIALIQGALKVDSGGKPAKKVAEAAVAAAPVIDIEMDDAAEPVEAAPEAPVKKRAPSKRTPKAAKTDTVIGELAAGAVEVGGDMEIDHDPNMIDLTGEEDHDD